MAVGCSIHVEEGAHLALTLALVVELGSLTSLPGLGLLPGHIVFRLDVSIFAARDADGIFFLPFGVGPAWQEEPSNSVRSARSRGMNRFRVKNTKTFRSTLFLPSSSGWWLQAGCDAANDAEGSENLRLGWMS
ncbi:hypothetical protein BDW02DRAFT_648451 [Decorospora gaudefroyi]|uniref:Uncharacterized protein n=1 Tax=Decorospora gaudefroyi TaxID=184978 RepID=A0A6A5K9V8_9PLEO|nr:hypothetical protein BDW02DRAFT_648451 [Decorospora gaudefroyi]